MDKIKNMQENKQNPNQDDYDIFVAQGIKLASKLAKNIKGNASIDTLGSALYEIVNKVEDNGAKHGIKFGIDVLFHAPQEILSYLISISDADLSEDQVKSVIGIAVGKYIKNGIKTGKLTKDQLAQAAQEGGAAQSPNGLLPTPGGQNGST